jgi:hypothetical protein
MEYCNQSTKFEREKILNSSLAVFTRFMFATVFGSSLPFLTAARGGGYYLGTQEE